jgi:hypothetical protein
VGLNTPKPFGAPLFIESFPTIPSTSKGRHGLGDFNMTNKLSSLINKCVVRTSLCNSSIINDLYFRRINWNIYANKKLQKLSLINLNEFSLSIQILVYLIIF